MYQDNDFYHDESGNSEFSITRFQKFLYNLTYGFSDKLSEGKPYMNCACVAAVRLNQGFIFNAEKMQQAIQKIFDCNDAFRTILVKRNDEIKQKILLHYDYELDLRKTYGNTIEEKLADAIHQSDIEGALPILNFDQVTVKFIVFKIAEDDYLILTVQNHLVSDGNSTFISLKQLISYYDKGKMHTSVGTFHEFNENEFLTISTEYGKNKIEELKHEMDNYVYSPDFVVKEEDKNVKSSDIGTKKIDLKEILAFARKNKTSYFYITLAAYHIALSIMLKTDDTIISFGAANRNDERFTNTIGLLVRTLPHRMKIDMNETFSQLLSRTIKSGSRLIDEQAYASYDMRSPFFLTIQSGSTVGGLLKLSSGTAQLVQLGTDRQLEVFALLGNEFSSNLILSIQCAVKIYGSEFVSKVSDITYDAIKVMMSNLDENVGEFINKFK